MSKQHTQSQGTRRESSENNQNAQQLPDRQDRANTSTDRANDKQPEKGGGEESKHGRKQKGNVDDT